MGWFCKKCGAKMDVCEGGKEAICPRTGHIETRRKPNEWGGATKIEYDSAGRRINRPKHFKSRFGPM